MNVELTPRLEALVREKVDTGRYNNASEVVRDALHLMKERDRLSRLKAAIAVGDDEIARGDVLPWTPDFMERLKDEAAEEDRQSLPISDDVQWRARRAGSHDG